MPRHPLGDRAMTDAERQRKRRDRLRQERETPEQRAAEAERRRLRCFICSGAQGEVRLWGNAEMRTVVCETCVKQATAAWAKIDADRETADAALMDAPEPTTAPEHDDDPPHMPVNLPETLTWSEPEQHGRGKYPYQQHPRWVRCQTRNSDLSYRILPHGDSKRFNGYHVLMEDCRDVDGVIAGRAIRIPVFDFEKCERYEDEPKRVFESIDEAKQAAESDYAERRAVLMGSPESKPRRSLAGMKERMRALFEADMRERAQWGGRSKVDGDR
jgi:hypothetical protein